MELNEQAIAEFQETVWRHYDQAGRDLIWRHVEANGKFDPYKIMVSEIMLQQTQVNRVTPKYQAFLKLFPDVKALSSASLAQVLAAWSGLGYNRRAKFLWQAAQMVMTEFDGIMPKTVDELQKLPGIGHNTACAIMAYAYNVPVVFIETNIRTVFIHHFFRGQMDVADKQILELVTQTLPKENAREWYWAIMDYGSHLKATVGNPNKNSKHYTKQSTFHGSKRQIRGAVIRLLTTGPQSLELLQQEIGDERLQPVLGDLLQEKMIQRIGDGYSL